MWDSRGQLSITGLTLLLTPNYKVLEVIYLYILSAPARNEAPCNSNLVTSDTVAHSFL